MNDRAAQKRSGFASSVPRIAVLMLAGALAACSPALDWRDVRVPASSVTLLMPCRPSSQTRTVGLVGKPVSLTLLACSAGGQTWGVAFADVVDPARVGPAFDELLSQAANNLGAARESLASSLSVPGGTPHAGARQLQLVGRLPDGRSVAEAVGVFSVGTVVYQVTALGESLPAEAVRVFFGSLRVVR